MLDTLNSIQKQEIFRQAGNGQNISPEGLAHAMQSYVHALKEQAWVAKAFYFGRLEEGFEGLIHLPEDIRIQIDQLIWDVAGEEVMDPTLPRSQALIAAAIMYSIEMRMGISE